MMASAVVSVFALAMWTPRRPPRASQSAPVLGYGSGWGSGCSASSLVGCNTICEPLPGSGSAWCPSVPAFASRRRRGSGCPLAGWDSLPADQIFAMKSAVDFRGCCCRWGCCWSLAYRCAVEESWDTIPVTAQETRPQVTSSLAVAARVLWTDVPASGMSQYQPHSLLTRRLSWWSPGTSSCLSGFVIHYRCHRRTPSATCL